MERALLGLFTLLSLIAAALIGPTGGHAQKIQALLIGKVMPEYPPASWFACEPLVDYALVPTGMFGGYSFSIEEAQRSVRAYFPRSDDKLHRYDFFTYRGVYMEAFAPSQIEAMRSAIVNRGSGALVEIGGITKNWAEGVNWPWVQSTLASVFPNDPDAGEVWAANIQAIHLPYKVVVNRDPSLPPLLRMFLPLGIEGVRGYWYIVLIVPRQGSTTWGWAKGAYPGVLGGDPPWLLSWKYHDSVTWSLADAVDAPWWDDVFYPSDQKYGLDIMMNLILYSLGRPLPDNVLLVNSVRHRFELHAQRMSTLTSYMDFVERFGVSTAKLLEAKRNVDLAMDKAMDTYLKGDYQRSLEECQEALDSIHNLEAKVVEWKNQALYWVYLTEWTAVAGTLMITGYVLYLLMLHRRLYRTVDTTRMTR